MDKIHIRHQIINNCNYRCPICSYEGEEIPEIMGGCGMNKTLLSDENVISLMEEVVNIVGSNNISYAITGGEPTLRKDLLIKMVKRLNDLDIEDIWLNTNGFLLNSEYLDELKDAGLKHVKITISSMDFLKYAKAIGYQGNISWAKKALKKVLYNTDCCIENGLKVDINIPLQERINDSYEDLEPYFNFSKRGVLVKVLVLEPSGWKGFPKRENYIPPIDVHDFLKSMGGKKISDFDFSRGGLYEFDTGNNEKVTIAGIYFCSPADAKNHPYAGRSFLVTSDGQIKKGMWGDEGKTKLKIEHTTVLERQLRSILN
ncbi:radical SAM protein [Patescibacteria group bacterium]|nr:radical SAM protein [Patescibacteria group bacterium]